ncbi:MAG: nicotinate (nicotinamide) nucleotide adenylyltransferase [Treponema sp.]|nr:nicotinate (nicotinamide) nucleotide adenylyltransferase [Treponema sp.]
MKLAILGGSFNPVHLGHLFLADTVLSSFDYDRVVMIPAFRSPFKPGAPNMESTGADRLEMLAASIAGDWRLTIDNAEIRREGVSYTVDTVRDIISRYRPEGKPGLVIGDDLAAGFPQWRESGELLTMVDIIIARRVHSGEETYPYPCVQITNEVMEISSAMVRDRIAAGTAWRYLVPAAARAIITDRRLYGFSGGEAGADHSAAGSGGEQPADCAAADTSQETIVRVEQAARETLSLERFLHSRNTAVMAADLCRRFGLDPAQGYLAGIAHDLGKPLSGGEMLHLAKKDGRPISDLERKKTSLLHGRAAAVLLRERFGVHNKAVLEAAALHTGGGPDMGPLAKIVYIADKMEVSREKVNPAPGNMCRSGSDLDSVFFAVLDETVKWLRSKKLELSKETFQLLEKMKAGRKNP